MERPQTMTRADSTRRGATPTFQRPISRPASSRVFAGAPKPAAGGAVKHRPISYDYATGSTFSVKINGKPVFLLNDFRKKVDANVKHSRYVTAFKASLAQQVDDKKKQDAIRDQYAKTIVPRFRPVEHTEAGLTKNLLGQGDDDGAEEDPPTQGQIGYSRIDQIDPWENSLGGGLEKYNPCVNSVFAPVQFHGLDDTHPQWQREPSSHLSLDFLYGYQGSSCWDQELFKEGPGADNLCFLQAYNPRTGRMDHSGEIVYFAASTVVIFDVKNNIQRFFHHSDDVTALTVLKRVYQKPDATWEEMTRPKGAKAKEEWEKFFAYNKGVYNPSEKSWTPASRLLPESTEEFPQFDDGVPMDWRDWELPNRCVVASGQRGRNPRIYVWRVIPYDGKTQMNDQVLATMTLGKKRLLVASLSFNSRGNLLVALANDMDHTIVVFDWRKQVKIREGQGHGSRVDTCKFNPYSDSAFCSSGVKHLKFWELGEEEGLQMATGLFGDLGAPFDQRNVVFNPRGNTISGVENGDIYIWSSGTVSAKIENAHKADVLGMLYVDGVGLFTSGRGGMLKVWDPELRDTKNPWCVVDLRPFDVKGDPKLNNRVSGRAMDWSTSEQLLSFICDDNVVEDNPSKGVCGAPATHMSFRDLKVDGVLLLGTTNNSILMLGFKKTGEWVYGLPPDTPIRGDSANTTEDRLDQQSWWKTIKEMKYTKVVKNKDVLPVAVYWYQSNDETLPGYRPKTAARGGGGGRCPWKMAVCGKKVCMRGHMSHVDAVAPMSNERIFMSVGKDCTARFFDINDQIMIDSVYLWKPARSAAWWYKYHREDGVTGEEELNEKKVSVFCAGHEDGSFSVWSTEKTAADAADADDDTATENDPFHNPENAFGKITLCCSNPLPRKAPPPAAGRLPSEQAFVVRYSPNGKYLAVGLGDNCVDVYKHGLVQFYQRPERDLQREQSKQKELGFTDEEIERQSTFPYKRVGCCNDHSSAVTHLDFDMESQYIRSTSQSNELLFAFIPSGKQSTSTQELSLKQWFTDTCILGWTVKSIWAKGSLGSDINTLDRTTNKVPPWAPSHGGSEPSPYPYPDGFRPKGSYIPQDEYPTNNYPGEGTPSSWGHHVLATGDDSGKVKLFRWPAFGFKQAFRCFVGHGSQVAQVRFSYDDDYLISAGGADMSLFQWRHVIPNKIYVQNLPDRKQEDGRYVIGNSEMKEVLRDYFGKLFKVDRQDRDLQPPRSISSDQDRERELAKYMARVQEKSWTGERPDGAGNLPDREIVSVSIYSSGAANEGQSYPSAAWGSKVTSRWAAVVFSSKDEVDDVIDLYGHPSAVSYETMFQNSQLRLYPLYRQVDDSPAAQREAGLREMKQEDYDANKKPSTLIRSERDMRTGKKTYSRWEPLNHDDYEDNNGVKPHFLLITANDPNESPVTSVFDRNMAKVEAKWNLDKGTADPDWAEQFGVATSSDDVMEVYTKQTERWQDIQEWLMSDDQYGATSKTPEFRSFEAWYESRKERKGDPNRKG